MTEMLKIPKLSVKEAIELQKKLASTVIREDFVKLEDIEKIAGVDISFERKNKAIAACVSIDFESLEVVDKTWEKVELNFPYIPGLLAFREGEAAIKVMEKVEADVYLIDGHGIAHPRRLGIASHVGVLLDKVTVGVAKNLLCGKIVKRNGAELIVDKGEIIGQRIKPHSSAKYIYVSIGHKISLSTAVEVVRRVTPKECKLPKPTLLAHELSTSIAKGLQKTLNDF